MLLAAPISRPITEELARGLGVIVIFWLLRAEHNGVRDGIVYGALVGAGFNWFETALYVAQGYAEYRVAPYGLQLGGRYGSGLAGTRYLPACSVPYTTRAAGAAALGAGAGRRCSGSSSRSRPTWSTTHCH
jgi:RsiW-degrading membrane proteinase PrsW (M82 family)